MEKEAQMKAFESESKFDKAYEKFLADLPQAGGVIRNRHARMEDSFRSYLDAFEKWVFRHAYEAGYAAALAGTADEQGCQSGEETAIEQLRREALYAQRSYSEELLHKIYGGAVMAKKLGAITEEEFMEINEMTIRFMRNDQEYIRRKNGESLHGADENPVKEYRVKFWRSDEDGREDYIEFDREEQAMIFYNSLDGKAEVQKYIGERHEYEAVVYPEFEV